VCSVLNVSLRTSPSCSSEYSHLPDDFPGESDVVEQGDKEGHADKDIGGIWVGLDKRGTGSQYYYYSQSNK
jgi:hypothetical protein